MRMKKHKGAPVKSGGMFVKEEDYNGDYAVEFQTESGEVHEFILDDEQRDRLNTLTEEPVGRRKEESSLVDRLLWWR